MPVFGRFYHIFTQLVPGRAEFSTTAVCPAAVVLYSALVLACGAGRWCRIVAEQWLGEVVLVLLGSHWCCGMVELWFGT